MIQSAIQTKPRAGATYLQALRAIALQRRTLFFNGTLYILNFHTLTITNTRTLSKTSYTSFVKLANALQRGELPFLAERVREIYATIE
jgi:hypothetical protein